MDDQRGLYEGSALEFPDRGDEPIALRHAILDAYRKGMEGKGARFTPEDEPIPYRFRVAEIYIEGTNPPSDYKVQLIDD
jgi:hypothetical protein